MGTGLLVHRADRSEARAANDGAGASAWCTSRGKRAFDCAAAGLLLLALTPLMAAIAMAVMLSASGPVLFRQRRVGRCGREFNLIKFRTMRSLQTGPLITRNGDSRVTTVGAFLRRWKLDELPQLINVIKGDMAMVGPRPEIPQYVARFNANLMRILQLRPGITGAASIEYRDEEQILAQAPADELENFYLTRVLPDKAQKDWEYARRATLLSDLRLLLTTARVL